MVLRGSTPTCHPLWQARGVMAVDTNNVSQGFGSGDDRTGLQMRFYYFFGQLRCDGYLTFSVSL